MVAGVGETPIAISKTMEGSVWRFLVAPRIVVPVPAPARDRRKRWLRVVLAADSVIMVSCVLLAVLVSDGSEMPSKVGFAVAVLIFWSVALSVKGARQSQVFGVGSDEYKRIFEAGVLTAGMASLVALKIQPEFATRVVLDGVIPGIGVLLFARWILRRVMHARARRGATLSRVIVVGGAVDIRYLVDKVQKNSPGVYQVVGAIEDSGIPFSLGDIPCNRSMDDLESMLYAYGADAVIVAGELNEGSKGVTRLSWELEKTNTELILASRLTNVAGPRIKMRPVEGLPLMHVDPPVFSGGRMWAKRALDIMLAVTALILLSPLFAIIALLVRADSQGPVIFSQRRVGKDGREFTMYKFRTMVPNAEQLLDELQQQNQGAGPLFKMKNDPRITRVGQILRKLSLDELPQIYNVLSGDMSLVGPRPPLQSEVDSYERYTYRRLLIRPGLTGLWQTRGRSDLAWEESVSLDLYYVENWSVIGDLIIMWHTAKAMIQPQGAY